eukprot:COSAG05_NODE_7727_length_775_cov_1.897929_2_plen_132_part_00
MTEVYLLFYARITDYLQSIAAVATNSAPWQVLCIFLVVVGIELYAIPISIIFEAFQDVLAGADDGGDEVDESVVRALKLQANISHAWFLNDRLYGHRKRTALVVKAAVTTRGQSWTTLPTTAAAAAVATAR